jgi:hypothetical protein
MKRKKSKLDAFEAEIEQWDHDRVTLEEMRRRLAERGVTVSVGRLSLFLAALRQRRLTERLLPSIATGARMCREIEQAFAENPAPSLATLVEFQKRLILELQVRGANDPELLKTANDALRVAISAIKAEHERAALALEREKFQRATAEAVLRAARDQRIQEIAASDAPAAEKIERVGRALFGDLWSDAAPQAAQKAA